jgi:hypothetical protein
MGTTAAAGNTTIFKPAPAGNHLSICIGVIDLGTQEKVFEGKVSWKPTVKLIWELCDELRDDGKPFTLSRDFTLSLHERSGLRPFLVGWRGRDFTDEELQRFDVQNLLGVPCMLNVVHKPGKDKRIFANVTAANPLPKRTTAPDPISDLWYYSTDDGPPPDSLPEWLRKRIMLSKEFRDKAGRSTNETVPGYSKPPEDNDDEEPPF